MPTRVMRPTTDRLANTVVERWAEIPASIAADLFDGQTVIDPSIRPLRPLNGRKVLVGSAVTAFCEGTDYGAVHHAIAVAEVGDFLVIEAGGRNNPAVIGELLSGAARRKGVVGAVVNGAVRDTGRLVEWPDFTVFARHRDPRGPSSMERGQVNGIVAFAGTRVAPHDIILGDDDGLVVIPRDEAEARLDAALARVAAEAAWERELSAGRTTLEVFEVPTAD